MITPVLVEPVTTIVLDVRVVTTELAKPFVVTIAGVLVKAIGKV